MQRRAMQKRAAWEAMTPNQRQWVQGIAETFGIKRIVITTETEIYDSEIYLKRPGGRPINPQRRKTKNSP